MLIGNEDENDGLGSVAPWVLVAQVSTEWEASMVVGSLESAGVRVQLVSQIDGNFGLPFSGFCVAKIYVPHLEYERAKEVLSAPLDTSPDNN